MHPLIDTVCRYSGLTLAKNLVMIMTGFFTGLVGVILSKTVKTLIEYRNDAMESILDHSDSFVQAFIFNMAYGVTLVMAAACMVRCPFATQPLSPGATRNH